MAILLGTLGDDTINGTEGGDLITALTGNDTVYGNGGIDVIDAGSGDDIVYAGSNTRWDDAAIDTVLAGDGDDNVYAGYGDLVNGGFGFDLLSLDLSSATNGVDVNFKPFSLLELGDLLTLKIDGTTLTGFQAVTDLVGTNFDDRFIMSNSAGYGTNLDAGGGDDTVRGNRGDDHLSGGIGDDRLKGGRGADVLSGDAGDDRLAGGRNADTLTGGSGHDMFVFDDGDTVRRSGDADKITDFSHDQGDKISLRLMDAIQGGEDDQFSFIGDSKFTGTAGELRFVVVGDDTFVRGDTDGDGAADFTIHLVGAIDLVKSDFQL